MCPRSSDPFYIVSYYIKWVTTSWTYSREDEIYPFLKLFSSHTTSSVYLLYVQEVFIIFTFTMLAYHEYWTGLLGHSLFSRILSPGDTRTAPLPPPPPPTPPISLPTTRYRVGIHYILTDTSTLGIIDELRS